MYISNEKELVQRLKENNLTEWEVVQQYLAMMLMYIAGIDTIAQVWGGTERSWPGIIVQACTLICGTLYCYNVNKNGDNKDFIKRIICLAVPVAFNLALIFIFLFGIFYSLIGFLITYNWPDLFKENPMIPILATLLLSIIYVTMYYWRLSKQIYNISH